MMCDTLLCLSSVVSTLKYCGLSSRVCVVVYNSTEGEDEEGRGSRINWVMVIDFV